MKSYIQKVINYFFRHNVSDELTKRVYERITFPIDDKEREEAIENIWNGLEGVTCPEEETERAFQKLCISDNKRIGVKEKGRKVSWPKIAAIWTIPLIMLCFSAYYFTIGNGKRQDMPLKISYIQHYAPIGTREQVILPDSSTVWLNAGSLLVYPSTFLSNTRDVYLSGEAFFEVVKDKEHPFIVSTNYLQMKVLGTTFNVSAYPENDQIKATLETGLLQVEVKHQTERFWLSPDEQLVYTPATGKVERFNVKAAEYSDWRMGGLFFNDVPFDDVLRTLERTYGIKFHLQTSIYQNQNLRVHFNKNESLENVLKIIKILIPGIEYEIQGKNVYLK